MIMMTTIIKKNQILISKFERNREGHVRKATRDRRNVIRLTRRDTAITSYGSWYQLPATRYQRTPLNPKMRNWIRLDPAWTTDNSGRTQSKLIRIVFVGWYKWCYGANALVRLRPFEFEAVRNKNH